MPMENFDNSASPLESEDRYRQLVELCPDLIAINYDGKIAFINSAGAKLLGAESPDQLIGRSVKDFIHTQNYELSRQRLQQLRQSKSVPSIEETFIRLDGTVFYAEASAMPITYCGKPAILVVAHDITERKLAEEEVLEQERCFRSLTESTPDAVALVDHAGNIMFCNTGAQNMFGYTEADLLGKPASMLIPAEDRKNHWKGFEQLHATGESRVLGKIFESRGLRQDGSIFPTEISMSSWQTRKGTLYSAVLRDITERKQAEKALNETKEYLDNLIDSSLDGIVAVNNDGHIIRANSYFMELIGYQREEIIGKRIAGFFPLEPGTYHSSAGATVTIDEDHIKDFRDIVGRLFTEGKVDNWLTHIICKNSLAIPVSLNIVALHDRQQQVIGALGIMRNITEQKKAENKLRESHETLRTLINAAPETLFLMDTEGRVIIGNEMMASRFNTNTDNLPGMCVYDYFTPDVQDLRKQYAMEAKTNRKRIHFEDCRNNSYLENFVHPITNEDGVVDRLAIYSLDITKRKQAEEELRRHRDHLDELVKVKTAELTATNQQLQQQIIECTRMAESVRNSEDQYRMLVQSANSIILRMDQHGTITFLNEFGQQFFDFSEDGILGKNVLGTIVPQTDTLGSNLEEMILDIGRYPECYAVNENENMLRSGKRVWVSWTNKAILDDAGMISEILCIGHDITARKRAEEKLLSYQKQLQSLASELSLAEERERRRIAVELHDSIAQNLAISKIKISELREMTDNNGCGHIIDEIDSILQQTIRETRSLSFELCPPFLYELGFETALEWLAEQTSKKHGLAIRCESDKQPKPLADDIRVVLFQATRELLANIAKHARARTGKVSITRQDNQIRIDVEDDGVGFDFTGAEARVGSRDGGFGLFSIRERMKYLGGCLECASGEGRGTRMSLVAPLKIS